MDEIVRALAAQHDELAALLDPLTPDDWRRPTPCEGWDIAAVVLHLAQSDELALASVEGRFGERIGALTGGDAPDIGTPDIGTPDIGTPDIGTVDEGVERLVSKDRETPPDQIHERWRSSAAAVRAAFASADPHTRVQWAVGAMAARTLATTRLAETWIHTGDVAAALDTEVAATDHLWHIARLAWRTLPYAFERDGREAPGSVAFHLVGPDGSAWDFDPSEPAATVITGDALELCLVAARRVGPDTTALVGEGPEAGTVLDLVRTWA